MSSSAPPAIIFHAATLSLGGALSFSLRLLSEKDARG